MRRGPDGPRTLCNACGLMWANKINIGDLLHDFDYSCLERREKKEREESVKFFDTKLLVSRNIEEKDTMK